MYMLSKYFSICLSVTNFFCHLRWVNGEMTQLEGDLTLLCTLYFKLIEIKDKHTSEFTIFWIEITFLSLNNYLYAHNPQGGGQNLPNKFHLHLI